MMFYAALAWELLAICIVMFGKVVNNGAIGGVGAVMLLFTCAFAW